MAKQKLSQKQHTETQNDPIEKPSNSVRFSLSNLNLRLHRNQVVLITEIIGSGKSSISSSLLGEMEIIEGSVRVAEKSSISVCVQKPILCHDKIRNNILFGQKYEEDFYQEIVNDFQLSEDFQSFEHKDLQLVKSEGENLSGSQKARIALAQCFYSRKDTCININVLALLYYRYQGNISSTQLCTYFTLLSSLLQYTSYIMGQFIFMASGLSSVKRFLELKYQCVPETILHNDLKVKAGEIQFQNVFVSYDEQYNQYLAQLNKDKFLKESVAGGTTKYQLNSIDITIKPKEKIGLIGRTGSGKSSFAYCLLGLTSVSKGKILIDGQDISQFCVKSLRRQVSIIHQTSWIFEDTVRKNLDPFNEFPEEEVWNALKETDLQELVQALPQKLDTFLPKNKNNFTCGQKQLFCIAKAMLRKSKIVVLDEATANIDLQTDKFIKQKMDKIFQNSTMIIIAHRLTSVLHCDRVVMLKEGRVVEQGQTQELLNNKDSLLYEVISFAQQNTDQILAE